jgi:hypothetical protein
VAQFRLAGSPSAPPLIDWCECHTKVGHLLNYDQE